MAKMAVRTKKKWYTSKTIWVNAIAFAAAIAQFAAGKVVIDENIQVGILTLVNMVLRAITKEELH